MVKYIIALVIALLIFAFSLVYLIKEKDDVESRKIYGIFTALSGIATVICVVLTIVNR